MPARGLMQAEDGSWMTMTPATRKALLGLTEGRVPLEAGQMPPGKDLPTARVDEVFSPAETEAARAGDGRRPGRGSEAARWLAVVVGLILWRRRHRRRCRPAAPVASEPLLEGGGPRRIVLLVATWDDVRAIALELPGSEELTSRDLLQWKVKKKLFVWERPLRKADLEALGDGAPDGPILGARVEHLGAKEALLADDPSVYFTTPHFDGYPAVLSSST